MKIVYTENARGDAQRNAMEQAEDRGLCPFCHPGLEEIHRQPIEYSGTYWLLTPSAYPYDGTRVHYLLISTDHDAVLATVPHAAWAEFGMLVNRVAETHRIYGGAVVFRFGDPTCTGASVRHLHAHIIAGDTARTDTCESIKVKVGYKKTSGDSA